MKQEKSVEIVPDTRLMEDIGATSFTVPEAIVELVANSFDARIGDDKLIIRITLSPERISVIDDACGMDVASLSEAIRLSVNMEKLKGKSDVRKGMFGLGMKTACASLGRVWSITTRPDGGKEEHSVEFDLREWSKRSGSKNPEWKAVIKSRNPDPKGPLGSSKHGTAIVITELRDKNPMPGAVLERVGRAFKPHIESGDIIYIGKDKAVPPPYNLIGGKRAVIDEPCLGDRITGWVGLDVKTHNDDSFGLNLYRKGQLLVAWDKSFFPVHLMTSRIVGEINLDFVPPNFHKKGFETQSREWKEAYKKMREVLKPVVKASRHASKGKKTALRDTEAIQILDGAFEPQKEQQNEAGEQTSAFHDDEKENHVSDGEVRVENGMLILPDGRIKIDHMVQDLEDEEIPWSHIFDPEAGEIQVIINKGSLIYNSTKDIGTMALLGAGDCLLNFLMHEMHMDPEKAWRARNRWLYDTIRQGSGRD